MKAKSVVNDFPVVCVGGSAGGLDAYTRLLRHLPADMGVAVVIVNHLRHVATLLHEILPRYTQMPVELITERLLIRPDRVFIIPPQRDLHVLYGEFRLKPISKPRGWPDVITVFLHSLTRHWDGKLIAVIVSGYDGDGAAALCGIKEVGGISARRADACCACMIPPDVADQAPPAAQAPQIRESDPSVRRSALPDAPPAPTRHGRAREDAVPAHVANVRRPARRGNPPAPKEDRRDPEQYGPNSPSFGPGRVDYLQKAPEGRFGSCASWHSGHEARYPAPISRRLLPPMLSFHIEHLRF